MKIVVDTNIVFSAILNSQSRIGQILLHSDKRIKFYSVKYLQLEIFNHFDKLKKLTKLSEIELLELIETLYTKIEFISEDLIPKPALHFADNLTKDIDFDDVLFVALSIHFNCKLWTGDKILIQRLKSKGFKKFITTKELIEKLDV